MPSAFRRQLLDWYHQNLKHPSADHMDLTVRQHFDYHEIQKDIHDIVRTFDTYQRDKMTATKNYGKLPIHKLNHTTPWEAFHTDMVDTWKVQLHLSKTKQKFTKEVKTLTIVDRKTAWPEFIAARRSTSSHVTKLFDSEWLCRNPRPTTLIHDNGGEFTGNKFQEFIQTYEIIARPTTVKIKALTP